MFSYCKYPLIGSIVLVFFLPTHPFIPPPTHLLWSNYLHPSIATICWALHLPINQAIILFIRLFNSVSAFIYLSTHPHVSPSFKRRWMFISHFKYGPNIILRKNQDIKPYMCVCVYVCIHEIIPAWSTYKTLRNHSIISGWLDYRS